MRNDTGGGKANWRGGVALPELLNIRMKIVPAGRPTPWRPTQQSGHGVIREGKLALAEPLMKRALALHEKTLGPNHPDVAIDLMNLGIVVDIGDNSGRRRNRC